MCDSLGVEDGVDQEGVFLSTESGENKGKDWINAGVTKEQTFFL